MSTQSTSIAKRVRSPDSRRGGKPRKRAEQEGSQATRSTIPEASPDNPRLDWVAETVLKPLIDRLLPQIKAAQTRGLLPRVEPILFHYMMVSLTAALSEFAPEMRVTRRLSADRPEVIEAYWKLV